MVKMLLITGDIYNKEWKGILYSEKEVKTYTATFENGLFSHIGDICLEVY